MSEFDHRTSIINSKGKTVLKQDYILKIDGGVRKYERPPGSGLWYDSTGELLPESQAKLDKKMDSITEDLMKDVKHSDKHAEKAAKPEVDKTLEAEQAKGGSDPQAASKHAEAVANGHEAANYAQSKAEAVKPLVADGEKAGQAKDEKADSKK